MAGRSEILEVLQTPASIVSNSAGSGMVAKVVTLVATNTSESDISLNVEIKRGAESYNILKAGVVPGNKSLSVFLSKDFGVFLEQGDELRLFASGIGIEAVCSYELVDSGSSSSSSSGSSSSSSSILPSSIAGYLLRVNVNAQSSAFGGNPLPCDGGTVAIKVNDVTLHTITFVANPMRTNPVLNAQVDLTLPSGTNSVNNAYVFSLVGSGVNCDAYATFAVTLYAPGDGPDDTPSAEPSPVFHAGTGANGIENTPIVANAFNIQTTFTS